MAYRKKNVWTPRDPSLRSFTRRAGTVGWQFAETHTIAWEKMEASLLSCQPPPPAEQREAIKAWLHAADEITAPFAELCRWIVAQETPRPPRRELRLMILEAEQNLPDLQPPDPQGGRRSAAEMCKANGLPFAPFCRRFFTVSCRTCIGRIFRQEPYEPLICFQAAVWKCMPSKLCSVVSDGRIHAVGRNAASRTGFPRRSVRTRRKTCWSSRQVVARSNRCSQK